MMQRSTFAMNRDSMIEEEIYRLEKKFGIEDLRNALKECSEAHMLSLRLKLETRDSTELLYIIEDIRDAWIKRKAEEIVEEA